MVVITTTTATSKITTIRIRSSSTGISQGSTVVVALTSTGISSSTILHETHIPTSGSDLFLGWYGCCGSRRRRLRHGARQGIVPFRVTQVTAAVTTTITTITNIRTTHGVQMIDMKCDISIYMIYI